MGQLRPPLLLLFELACLVILGQEVKSRPPNAFQMYERYPDQDEIETCGNIRDIIRRNWARFRKILVRNTNANIVFANNDCRRMTARTKSKLDVLASRVRSRWNNVRLKVLLSWTDQILSSAQISLHYEGRAVRFQTSDGDSGKLGELAALSVESGFDWVHFASSSYVHASVIRDVCQTSVDLTFILDSSGSVGRYNFGRIKTFVKNVIDFFNIGTNGTHVAVVTYSTWPTLEFNLKAYYTKISIKNAVGNIRYNGGQTYTADALDFARKNIFTITQGMRPDQGIPKVAVLLTDGYSNGRDVAVPAQLLRDLGVNIFSIGVGHYVNPTELNLIASDPDSTHVFRMSSFNDLAGWVDKLSAVSCDEGASVSSCDDTITSVESDSFKYFRTQFNTIAAKRILVEIRDIQGISHLYASLTNNNPGPMDVSSAKNESIVSPRAISLPLNRANTLVYVAVQGQMDSNKFKLSMWDALFQQDTYVASVTEDKAPGVSVIIVSSPYHYSLRYSFVEGNDQNNFKINQLTGQISTVKTLDRESGASYRLTVLGQNTRNRCHKGRTVVVVNVQDINDNSPVFEKPQYSATIAEEKPPGTLVATVTATDQDSGKNAQLSYNITLGNDAHNFVINNNGQVKTTQVLDFEEKQSYKLTITVQDGGSPARKASTILTVTVQDQNEAPYFINSCAQNNTCVMSVFENESPSSPVGHIQALDPDKCNSLNYKILTEQSQTPVFAISNSGEITTLSSLDRELKEFYTAVVTVEDCGKPTMKVTTRITIKVLDRNDATPSFALQSYTAAISEDVGINSFVLQVTASDGDVGSNGELWYSLVSGDIKAFHVNPQDGTISSRIPFDRETKNSYSLTLRASDKGLNPLSGTTLVNIVILDVNDNGPKFLGTPYNSSVTEGAQVGRTVFKVAAKDVDQGINADLRYSIVKGNEHNSFFLGSKSGILTTIRHLDYETRQSYTLDVMVTDRGYPSLMSITQLVVDVQDENDNSPVFSLSSYRATVRENTPIGTTVLKVSATDLDSGSNQEIIYAIVQGNADHMFSLDPNAGILSVNNSPDFEKRSQYTLRIEAADKGHPSQLAYTSVQVIIEDINDHTPRFNQTEYLLSLSEGVSLNRPVGAVFATDLDTGPRGRVFFTITDGNVGNLFAIDGNTGHLVVLSKLDREKKDSYVLTVEARDNGQPTLSSTSRVKITILDINDNKPLFDKNSYSAHVSEDATVGETVIQVFAKDNDLGKNAMVSYGIERGNEQDVFLFNQTTGLITLKRVIDREKKAFYSLVVYARDHGVPPLTSSVSVTVRVDDVNDNAPQFLQSQYNCSIAENLAKGIPVCFITASDPDSGANGRLYYSVTAGNTNNAFVINTDTGELTTYATLDRETTAVYQLKVMAEDSRTTRSDKSLNGSTSVLVYVMDENDNEPIFEKSNYTFFVREDASKLYDVGRVKAEDKDTGANGRITYHLVAGNMGNSFEVGESSGVIQVKSRLDREHWARISLILQAKDSGKPSLTANVPVVVIIDDVNDNPPVFSAEVFYGSVREDASPGSTVLQVKASDADAGANGQLLFHLQGPGQANFTIDPRGFIHTSTPLDYETTSHYLLTVNATDEGSPPQSASARINITVINVNDNVPVFETSSEVATIPEDVAIGTQVVRLNATDSDGSALRFDIKSGNKGNAFAIDKSTGLITVAARLDREATANYTLAVMATDTGGKSVVHNASLQVTDVNDNAPQFTSTSYFANVMENLQPGQFIAAVSASDRDEGLNSAISYEITAGHTSKFSINAASGVIRTSAKLDREETPSFRLIVTAKDHGTPSLSSTATVYVTVQDENDNIPAFPWPLYNVSVLENTAILTSVLRVAATDPDAGDNGRVTYSIISGNIHGAFALHKTTGFVSVNQTLDRETVASYSLNISASDNGQYQKISFVRVNVIVLDENDNAPQFDNKSPNFTIAENSKRGTIVGAAFATDRDVGSNGRVVFAIAKGNEDGVFKIGADSGQITVEGAVDRETKAIYSLSVMASDTGFPIMATEKKFYVTVADLNDNSPEFANNVFKGSVKENNPAQTTVLQVTATDKDTGANAVITYAITAGNSQWYFTIDSSTGFINTTAEIDYEKTPFFNLTVSASDSKFTAYATVIVEVINENDNSPEFSKANYICSVRENSMVMTAVTQVLASDVDPFGQLIYTIEAGNHSDRFSIDPTTGKITTTDILDREVLDTYFITVKATDRGKPALHGLATMTVTVLDDNDNQPKFSATSFSTLISENAYVTTSVIKVNATDKDTGANARISYNITWCNDMSAFIIEENTGTIRTNKKLDRENISSYVIMCEATDHGKPRLRSTPVAVHITVADVNDNSPIFDQPLYSVNISEDVTSGTIVQEVHAVDFDAKFNGKVVYNIRAGNEDGKFAIDNRTGVVSVKEEVDREMRDFYSLSIIAADLGNSPRNSSAQLSITVIDVNDNKPQFNWSSLQGSILENSPASTSVMQVVAKDPDIGRNARLVFNFTSSAYNELFSLDSNSGEIIAKKPLDRELQSKYVLKISVSDQGTPQLSSSADVVINVIDVDDNCPKFEPAVYNITINENLPFNQSVVQVTATDVDITDSKKMMYAIRSGNTAGAFTIDRQGSLRVSAGGVDREVADNYQLVVRAGRENCGINDTGSGEGSIAEGGSDTKLAAVAVVNIKVTDVNDNAPRFVRSFYEFDLRSVNTKEIGRVDAKDDDLGAGGVVKFRLVEQTELEGKRQVTVEAYDQGIPSLNSSTNVIITTSITCEAMVFQVTEDGIITTDTLCTFMQTPSAATRLVGDKYQLNCSAKGNTQPQYRWMKDGRFVSNWHDVGDYLIEHVTEDDEGGYSCLASSAAGLIQSSVANLIANERPAITEHPVNSTVELGGSVTLTCKASGDPEPKYLWFKDGVALPEASGINPLLPSLSLEKAVPEDEAQYFCQTTNVAGIARSNWASLKVFGKETLLSMKLTARKPNPEKTCQMFDVTSFKKVLSDALGAHVEVTEFAAPGRCQKHPCDSNPCHNGGVCSRESGESASYSCLCKPGWSGNHCELDVNECEGDPCFYGGSCLNTKGSYKCNCSSSKTGRNCELTKQACDGKPCNGSDVCVLSEGSSAAGFRCVIEQRVMAVVLSTQLTGSLFDLENDIESLIKSAPNNANRNSTSKRGRRSNEADYGACSIRIISYNDKDKLAHFVLLCPSAMEAILESQRAQVFVCGLLFEVERATWCGSTGLMMTPKPPTTNPPLQALIVTLEFFVRDSNTGKALEPDEVITMINSEEIGISLKQQGFKVERIEKSYTQPQTVQPSSKVGLIAGISVSLVFLAIVISVVAVLVIRRRNKPFQYHHSLQQRAVARRQSTQESMVQRNMSVKDITRSERHYLNGAYEDNGNGSDDEEQFMVQVELNNTRKRTRSKICNEPYFYDDITSIEAEGMLSSMVKPGTFLVHRSGEKSKDYILTVKAPMGGPAFRHLPITYAKNGHLKAQFGSMETSMTFESMNDLVNHFQITPILFDEDSPDVVLTHPWNRSEV